MSEEHVAAPGGLRQKLPVYQEIQQLDLIFLPTVQHKRQLAFSYINANVSAAPPEEIEEPFTDFIARSDLSYPADINKIFSLSYT